MKKQWLVLRAKIDALSQRERLILVFILTVGVLLLAHVFLFDPLRKKLHQLEDKNHKEQAQIVGLQSEIEQRMAGIKVDLDAEIKQGIVVARQRLKTLDNDLQDVQRNLVLPEKMDAFLEGILKRNKNLQLASLRSLPVVNLIETPVSIGNATDPTGKENHTNFAIPAERSIYKHEVELVVQGNYLDMLAYLRELEAMPERVYWSKSSLQVVEYPKARLSLNLFTLSLEKKWINL
ncbi:MAG: MSHA biogenesis protein MshJ [Undibacterium sp.]|nr:MSHA biogenesis protein MshJ [Undibacterium sp.]